MTSENKNKSRLKTKSGILALGLALIVLVGILSPTKISRAADDPNDIGTCTKTYPDKSIDTTEGGFRRHCVSIASVSAAFTQYSPSHLNPNSSSTEVTSQTIAPSQQVTTKETSGFSRAVSDTECGFGAWTLGGTLSGCLLQFFYYTLYMLGSFLLWLAALLFNFLISYTLNSELLRSDFIASAWGTVRDLSNIFFILVLLYIAIKIILDFGGSEAKKMIGKVVIIALLINFSMFFTQVIIDSSNILALIFYNKIEPKKTTGEPATDPNGKKDISGGLTKSFNPATKLDGDFFRDAGKNIILEGKPLEESVVSTGVLIGITVISGLIMMFAAYALFISSLSFLGRLIELFILIIFSPFAFISSTIPLLKNAEYLGWDNWFKRLLKVAFMAPIFMFFLYFIFLLLGSNDPSGSGKMFSSAVKGNGFWVVLLNLMIPALIILILLMKATKFAKEGSGAIGEAVIKAGSLALGVAGGVALGALAKGGQATVGKYGEKIAQSETAKRWVREGKFGADSFQKATSFLGGRDFDLRKGAVGGFLKSAEGVTGLNLGSASKFLLKPGGGYRGDRERAEKKRQERASKLKISEDEPLKQELNKKEEQLQEMSNESSHEIQQIDIRRETTRKTTEDRRQVRDATRSENEIAKNKLDNNTNNTSQEKDYNKAKATFDNIETDKKNKEKTANEAKTTFDNLVASGVVATDPTYIAAETAKNTAEIAVTAINPAYVAAETAKNTAEIAVTAINPAYVAAKDAYDETAKNYEEANDEYKETATLLRGLTNHRSAIKNTKGTADNFDMTNTNSAVFKADEAARDFATAKSTLDALIAGGTTITDSGYIAAEKASKKAEEIAKRAGEILNAAKASRDYGEGESINKYEDDIIPKAKEAIENENRERLISYAKRIRGSDDGVINALRTMGTTAGDDQASRNAAAHKIIMEVKIENNK